jgi:hypothetical protein
MESIYHKDYLEWPIDPHAQQLDNPALRKTHFVPGVVDQKRRFMSMYKEEFTPHPPGQNRQLNADVQKDLRSHHFNLGFDKLTPEDYTSEHHQEYIKRTIPLADKEQQSKMRALVSSSVRSD